MPPAVETLKALLSTVCFVVSFAPLWVEGKLARRRSKTWVIGGHRGRIYEDNSGELHRWIRENTDQPIVWIANRGPTMDELRAAGHPVLERNSLAARRAILRAPVLIYSHGEDDLDILMMAMRPFLGFRVFLNHAMCVLKAGQAFSPGYVNAGPVSRWARRSLMVDFDALLTTSELERNNLALSFPHRAARVFLGGGAHHDSFLRLRGTPAERVVYYFPTHRDDAVGRERMGEFLKALVTRRDLRDWLEAGGWTFRIGAHINTGSHALEVSAPFEMAPLSNLQHDLSRAALFVSDYSGLLGNFLVFDRPTIYVPFDWDNYKNFRSLHERLEDFAAGPLCWDLDSFVEAITRGNWADDSVWGPKRAEWRAKLFPRLEVGYAARCYETVLKLLSQPCAEVEGAPRSERSLEENGS